MSVVRVFLQDHLVSVLLIIKPYSLKASFPFFLLHLVAVDFDDRPPSSITASKIPHLTENCDWFRAKV